MTHTALFFPISGHLITIPPPRDHWGLGYELIIAILHCAWGEGINVSRKKDWWKVGEREEKKNILTRSLLLRSVSHTIR